MIFKLIHNPSNYWKVNIKLWFKKLWGRITRQRIRLTLIVIIFSISLNLIRPFYLGVFLTLIILVLIIDLIISMNLAKARIQETQKYLEEGGEELFIYAKDYFCYIQDGIEFKKVGWKDIHEYCIIKNLVQLLLKIELPKRCIYSMKMNLASFADACQQHAWSTLS